jgi:hypothetical protein
MCDQPITLSTLNLANSTQQSLLLFSRLFLNCSAAASGRWRVPCSAFCFQDEFQPVDAQYDLESFQW